MLNITKLFAGFVIAITPVSENFIVVSAQECSDPVKKTSSNKLYINCESEPINKVPKGYDSANVEVLNISYTDIVAFKESDFEPFKILKILTMKGLKLIANSVPENLFKGLLKLEELDISGCKGDFKIPTKLPVNLKYFYLNELDKDEIHDFTVLDNLVEISMKQSKYKSLPKLSDIAPLVAICLFGNEAMDDLHYENISKFCLLKTLTLTIRIQITHLESRVVQCCGLVIWKQMFNIEGFQQNFRCYEPCENVDVDISSDAIEARNECLVRHGLRLRKLWYNLITFFIAFVIISLLAFIAYKFYDHYYLAPLRLQTFVDKETMEEEEMLSITSSLDESSSIPS